MGYLKQRKREKLVNVILQIMLVVFTVALLCKFVNEDNRVLYYINMSYLHIYLLTIMAFIYCIFNRFVIYSIGFFILIFSFFMVLGSTTTLFLDNNKDLGEKISILYSKESIGFDSELKGKADFITQKVDFNEEDYTLKDIDDSIFSDSRDILSQGRIKLSPNYNAYFAIANIEVDTKIVLVNVDFANIGRNEAKTVFSNLEQFVELQESPVIIFGDFGVVSWSKPFSKFLRNTNLEVKNSISFANTTSRFNPFILPTVNLVGYKTLGLENIKLIPNQKKTGYLILFEIKI